MARTIQLASDKDVIVAPATAAGTAAIAIVRISGEGAITLGERLLGLSFFSVNPGQMILAVIRSTDANAAIDQCLAVHWRAPRSFTGENMVELHLHGSPAIVSSVLGECHALGARLAEPGEFTRRAFLNGKLDLAQAEAVAALTASQTADAARSALAQLQGGISQRLNATRSMLVQAAAELEASVDYPDEELPQLDRARITGMVRQSRAQLAALLVTYERGRRLMRGARIIFAGAPNAGKSSLFNALLRRERAIVTPHPGTTRDTIEATIDLNGIPLTLIDTAGLRDRAEEIEAIGIQRTREAIETADLLLFIVDAGESTEDSRREYTGLSALPHLVVFNKSDLMHDPANGERLALHFKGRGRRGVHFVSASTRTGLDLLESTIANLVGARESEGGSEIMVTSERHATALRNAVDSLRTVELALDASLSPEFVVVDLAIALSEVDSITGRGDLDESILDAVFSTFCLGK